MKDEDEEVSGMNSEAPSLRLFQCVWSGYPDCSHATSNELHRSGWDSSPLHSGIQ